MIPDQPLTQIIRCEVIKGGQSMFDRYLTDTFTKKNEKKRKPKDDAMDKKQDYSAVNLIKIERKKLPSNELLASELLKTNFMKEYEEDKMEDAEKFYEDFEAAQKLNEKVIKRFLKPLKKNASQTLGEARSQSPFQMFRTQSKCLLQKQTEIQLNNLDTKVRPKPKLQTKKQLIQQMDESMIHFTSDVKIHFRQLKFQDQLRKFNSESIENMCQQFKQLFASEGITNFEYNVQKSLQRFQFLIEGELPSYLRRSEYHSYSPLPWKTNQLEKELAKTSFQQINGKVLYKYEHNMGEIKEKSLKSKMYQLEREGFKQIQKYLDEKFTQKRELSKKAQPQIKELKRQKVVAENESKQMAYFSENLLSKSHEIQKKYSKPKHLNFVEPSVQNPPKYYLPNNKPSNSNAFNSNTIQNFINFRTTVPASSKFINHQQLNLDQYKFSKHDQYLHNESFSLQNEKRKSKEKPRNIIFHQNIQSPPKRRPSDTQQSKLPIQVQVYRSHQYDNFEPQSSSSEESKFFNTMSQYKQKKTTKKKKSFMKKTPPRSSSFGEIKIKENRSVILSKKSGFMNFYPLKIGNLILERKNCAYIEYNSTKQELKNLTVKFLIDQLKHGVNNVEIVVPSLGYQNQLTMKVNDQQKAKQMIKTILALGGNVEKIKPKSGYDEKTSGHEQGNRPKISTEIQIYKFFYKDLTYFEIIDGLNLEKQWLESERDDRKLGGWKY